MSWIRERRLGLVYHDEAKAAGGYTLFSPVRGHHADLLDADGRIVHQWHHAEGIEHVRWLASGNLLVHSLPPEFSFGAQDIGGSAGALFELDHDSNVVWEYRDEYMHHDYQRLDNGNTLVVRWERLPRDVAERVKGGFVSKHDADWMWGDVVREIDPQGNTVREWQSWEHISTDHHVKCPLESRKEWTHLNSLEITPDGHWLVSFRLTDRLAIVDGQSGEVRWRWGDGVLSHQHHATWLDNGNVLCFDNGCHRVDGPAFSQVLEIDPATKEIVWSYKATPVLAFFSFMVSGAERLANGNTLITEGATGRIFEVTTAGETVWEYVSPWIMPSKFGPTPAVFRSYRIPEGDPRLTGLALSAAPYDALNERIAGNELLDEADEPTA
ncbi:MAG TPA: aryl-sulfate sulfotransferase [Acidimicrobiales bacterium]|nr:aryl-sulfate sulfotransferase [Acidimicrobiales bacterium]